MDEDRNDDLRTMVREFRASVTDDLAATHRQMANLSDELRARITAAETALLAAVRDLARGLERVEGRIGGLESRMGGLETRMGGLETRMGGLETRLDGHDVRLTGIEGALRGER